MAGWGVGMIGWGVGLRGLSSKVAKSSINIGTSLAEASSTTVDIEIKKKQHNKMLEVH